MWSGDTANPNRIYLPNSSYYESGTGRKKLSLVHDPPMFNGA